MDLRRAETRHVDHPTSSQLIADTGGLEHNQQRVIERLERRLQLLHDLAGEPVGRRHLQHKNRGTEHTASLTPALTKAGAPKGAPESKGVLRLTHPERSRVGA
jgi:hypothetical protein